MHRRITILVSVLLFALSTCRQEKPPQEAEASERPKSAEEMSGEQLAQAYCASCHMYPDPKLLSKNTWQEHVLPRMGYFMGIYKKPGERESLLEPGEGGAKVVAAGVFPEKPTIDPALWSKIEAFYLEAAPESLDQESNPEIADTTPLFTPRNPNYRMSPPSTTYIQVDKGRLLIGDANKKAFLQFNQSLNMDRLARTGQSVVDYKETPQNLFLTVMGSFSPTDATSGYLLKLPKSAQEKPQKIIQNLQRPVDSEFADLNGDGQEDVVISEFAKWTGGLSWWENTGSAYIPHKLRDQPGAVKSYVRDLNQDSLPDIIALFGQGDEGIFAYYNQGEGNFKEEPLLRFHPSSGSSYFQFYDFNADGSPDILYCGGDNADYTPVLKPYHGIRIFLNDGNNSFEEKFFYPLHGAYKAIPADFDQDGDWDLAAISFFPDFSQGKEMSFVYLENLGNWEFKASTLPQTREGRWIVMDAGDLDSDGDLDIALGSLSFETYPDPLRMATWLEQGMPYMFLENTLK